MSILLKRQENGKHAALIDAGAGRFDSAVVCKDDRLGYRQPQPRAPTDSAALFGAVKTVKDVRL